MTGSPDPVAGARKAPYLNCPRCGLSIRPKARWLAIEHCPRCLARGRIAVKLFASSLPAGDLYPAGSAPTADGRRAARGREDSN